MADTHISAHIIDSLYKCKVCAVQAVVHCHVPTCDHQDKSQVTCTYVPIYTGMPYIHVHVHVCGIYTRPILVHTQ